MGYFSNNTNQQMNLEYYSGSQASIFIGDLWVDDICDWQCSLNYSASPIYGYGSTFYDHIAEGKVLVQGSFTINFKEPNYIWTILARYNIGNFVKNQVQDQANDVNKLIDQMNASRTPSYDNQKALMDTFFNQPETVMEVAQKNRNFLKVNAAQDENHFANRTFDIVIGYGSELNENTPGEKILGVKLTGKSKVIYQDGNPIKEQYNFFARNIV